MSRFNEDNVERGCSALKSIYGLLALSVRNDMNEMNPEELATLIGIIVDHMEMKPCDGRTGHG